MSTRIPGVYSSLGPFREAFSRQIPILMYHKVGPRPSRARLKGMYVEPRLFRRQMKELGAAGFASASPDVVLSGSQSQPPKIVLTFDDGYRNVLEHALDPMREAGLKAEGIIVDLHVVRVAPRLGLAIGTDPKKLEKQMMDILPSTDWSEVGMAISFLGRETCRPKNPKCPECVMRKVCVYFKTTG